MEPGSGSLPQRKSTKWGQKIPSDVCPMWRGWGFCLRRLCGDVPRVESPSQFCEHVWNSTLFHPRPSPGRCSCLPARRAGSSPLLAEVQAGSVGETTVGDGKKRTGLESEPPPPQWVFGMEPHHHPSEEAAVSNASGHTSATKQQRPQSHTKGDQLPFAGGGRIPSGTPQGGNPL